MKTIAVLWYMQGCVATFYQCTDEGEEQQKKKKLVSTESFVLNVNLAYRQLNSLASIPVYIYFRLLPHF